MAAKKKAYGNKSNGKGRTTTLTKPDGRKISRKLKPRQRAFVAEYTNPEGENFSNATKSALAAGYSEKAAADIGYENTKKPEISREIERALEEGGVTAETKVRVLREAMDANIVKVFCPKDGELVYADPLVDHQARLKAVELAGRITGDFLPNQVIERRETLIQQQNILIVPPQAAEPADSERVVRQLED